MSFACVRNRVAIILLTLLLVVQCPLAAASDSLGQASFVHLVRKEPAGILEVGVLFKDFENKPVTAPESLDNYCFTIGGNIVPATLMTGKQGGKAYVVVVDLSRGYSATIKTDVLQSLLTQLVTFLDNEDRIAFITVKGSGNETIPFQGRSEALKTVQGFAVESDDDAPLYDAIRQGLIMATDADENTPPYKALIVISDGLNNYSSGNGGTQLNSLGTRVNLANPMPIFLIRLYNSANTQNSAKEAETAFNSLTEALLGKAEGRSFPFDLVPKDRDKQLIVASQIASEIKDVMGNICGVTLDVTGLPGTLATTASNRYTIGLTYASDTTTELGSKDISLLLSAIPTPVITPAPTPEVTVTPEPVIEEPTPTPVSGPVAVILPDEKGVEVRKVQYRLQELFYYSGQGGSFDDETQRAVDLFCQMNNLEIMDGLSQEAYDVLFSPYSLPNPTATPSPTPTPTAAPVTPSPSPTPKPLYVDIKPGDKNEYVLKLQSALKSLNYFDASFTPGVYDAATQAAQDLFCKDNQLAMEIGASVSFQIFLLETQHQPRTTPIPVTPTPEPAYMAVKKGDDSRYVLSIQSALKELGYFESSFTPGVYDDATQLAQDNFCEDNNLAKEVGASVAFQTFLLENTHTPRTTATPVPAPGLGDQVRGFMVSPLQIGGMSLPMWIPVVAGILLVCVILIILLVAAGKRKRDRDSYDIPSSADEMGGDLPTMVSPMAGGAFDDDAMTVGNNVAAARPVSIEIRYNNAVRTEMVNISGRCAVGRQNTQVKLDPMDRSVSRLHCELYFVGNHLMVKDQSRLGTMVNGMPMPSMGEQQLNSGDMLLIGHHTLVVRYQ